MLISSPIPAAELSPPMRPCTCFHLRKLTRTVTRLYDRHLAGAGLKSTQYSLLLHVHHQAMPMLQLAEALGAERTTLTRNLRPLIESGWVELLPGGDMRQRIVTITEAGRDKTRAASSAWRSAQDELERLLGDDAVHALHAEIAFAQSRLGPAADGIREDEHGA